MKVKKTLNILVLALLLYQSSSSFAQNDTIQLLSWNVFLRPSIMSDKQMKRVDSIARFLNNSGADILILQEVFHRRARKRLSQLLEDEYPNQTLVGPKTIWGVSSGVMICSKQNHFISREFHHSFKNGTGSDKLAEKGMILSVFRTHNIYLNVVGTHLQAGSGEKRENIRMQQLAAIAEVIDVVADTELVVFAGDFNIDFTSPAMDSLQRKLNATTIPSSNEIKYTANFSDRDLFKHDGNDAAWIDFILLGDSKIAELTNAFIEEPRQLINGELLRLSDHNPIYTTIKLKL